VAPCCLRYAPSTGALLMTDSGARIRKIELSNVVPGPFSFTPVSNVALSSSVQSGPVTPAGYAAPTQITILDGEYSIGCAGTFVSSAGTINPGQSVCVRHVSANIGNKDTTTMLIVGGVRATFTSTTAPGPGNITLSTATLDF